MIECYLKKKVFFGCFFFLNWWVLIHILAVSGCFNAQMNYVVTTAEQEPQILFTFLIPVTQTLNEDDLLWSMERMTWKIDKAPSIAEKPRELCYFSRSQGQT